MSPFVGSVTLKNSRVPGASLMEFHCGGDLHRFLIKTNDYALTGRRWKSCQSPLFHRSMGKVSSPNTARLLCAKVFSSALSPLSCCLPQNQGYCQVGLRIQASMCLGQCVSQHNKRNSDLKRSENIIIIFKIAIKKKEKYFKRNVCKCYEYTKR